MSKWQAFLNSIATRGGAILILLIMTGVADGGAFTMYLRHDMDARGLAYFVTSGGMINALMLALKGSSEPTPPPAVQATQIPPSPNSPR